MKKYRHYKSIISSPWAPVLSKCAYFLLPVSKERDCLDSTAFLTSWSHFICLSSIFNPSSNKYSWPSTKCQNLFERNWIHKWTKTKILASHFSLYWFMCLRSSLNNQIHLYTHLCISKKVVSCNFCLLFIIKLLNKDILWGVGSNILRMKYMANNCWTERITVMPSNKMPVSHRVTHLSLLFLTLPASLNTKIHRKHPQKRCVLRDVIHHTQTVDASWQQTQLTFPSLCVAKGLNKDYKPNVSRPQTQIQDKF